MRAGRIGYQVGGGRSRGHHRESEAETPGFEHDDLLSPILECPNPLGGYEVAQPTAKNAARFI
jgi:hypothetical protein